MNRCFKGWRTDDIIKLV